ncbi:PAS domain-containing sensor histidine kinase [Neobacillus vireti]|uniref:histidine kinase n=1 Tax=Neobacillus vireti LMG 21834 TaxID=1131730 RepID=A0AB94IP68_9BACI|nr:PAS domain S-box protein [Neobacillus vireti]ETI68839.1 PAS/PAC sensor signal transduction histidine kinase [Neobacillus vireti LMG 21834]KLT19619.1 histidine kinase [Neobacillus vireti]
MENKTYMNWEFETIAKHTLDILLIVDHNQIVQFATPSVETILGYGPEEFVGSNAFDPLSPEDRDRLMASHEEAIMTGKPRMDEYRVFHKNGELKYFESRVMPVQNHPDNLVVVSIRDVTLRKKMESELERRKNRYQELQNSLKNFSQDLSGVMKVSELKSRLIHELNTVIPDSAPQLVKHNRESEVLEGEYPVSLAIVLTNLTVGKLSSENEKFYILIGDRKELAYILTMKSSSIKESMDLIWLETLVHYTVMVFESLNVIESLMSQLETAMQKSEKPQWMLRLLFNLSEKQRMKLSGDLHDTVLQEQLALYRNLESILKEYQFDSEVDRHLKEIVQGLLDTIHQIRMTCNELRPPLLREAGLISALENLFDYTQVSSTFKIIFSVENTENLVINEEETIGIYRIIQELLNNAAKHSQASNLHFHLIRTDECIHLHYLDDGVGFAAEKLTPSFKSMGLSGMRERIQSLNGTIDFASQPGKGLSVKMQIPLSV